MFEPNDQDETAVDEPCVPRAWVAKSVAYAALRAECTCPDGDCPHDHENE